METDNVELMSEYFTQFIENIDKFNDKGTAAAGTRARKALLEIGKLTKTIRKEIQEKKKE